MCRAPHAGDKEQGNEKEDHHHRPGCQHAVPRCARHHEGDRAKAARTKKAARKPAKAATKASAKKAPATAPRDGSKKSAVLALISRKAGASLEEIMMATGWQKHTVRGFISILGKKGTKIESSKAESCARTYRAG